MFSIGNMKPLSIATGMYATISANCTATSCDLAITLAMSPVPSIARRKSVEHAKSVTSDPRMGMSNRYEPSVSTSSVCTNPRPV